MISEYLRLGSAKIVRHAGGRVVTAAAARPARRSLGGMSAAASASTHTSVSPTQEQPLPRR
eukprot:6211796-Pleurochrysis_carterae.AAC.3